MSVFSDFQRMWVEKFPESSLSDVWEQDVRHYLARHRQRIVDLQKELEQETLYVEYLERLLSDVEKFRESGGDPQAVIEASTPTGAAALNALSTSASGSDVTSTTTTAAEPQTPVKRNSGESAAQEGEQEGHEDDVVAVGEAIGESNGENTIITPAPQSAVTPAEENISSTTGKDGNSSSTTTVQLRNTKDDQLNKCISELSSSFRRATSDKSEAQPTSTTPAVQSKPRPDAPLRPTSASHFVTVIEVKESAAKKAQQEEGKETSATEESEDDRLDEEGATATAGGVVDDEEDSQTNGNVTGQTNTTDDESLAESGARGVQRNKSSDSSGFGSDGQSNVMRLINKNNAAVAAAAPSIKSSTFSANSGDKVGLIPAAVDGPKKRIPPRPPPKNIRRAAPVEPPIVPNTNNGRKSGGAESPSSSLERNMKPSDFALLRQKSSDALELRQQHLDGRRATMLDEYNKKLRAEGPVEAIKKNQSPKSNPPPPAPSLLGKSPTGSLSKAIQAPRASGSPTFQAREGNANVGSKESLSSTPGTGGGGISDRIKSYESISSLSSDNPPRPNSQNQQQFEGEPLYDQVPMEQNDAGEYVYVQAGAVGMGTNSSNESGGRRRRLGTGSSSSRDDLSNAGSTLPMTHRLSAASNARSSVQMQQQFEPESPGRNSNYVNIDYFITAGNSRGGAGDEGRSSSVDSDGEGFAGPAPVLLRAISHDDQLPITPGAFKKLPTINSGELNSSGGSIDQLGIGGEEEEEGVVKDEGARKTRIRHIISSIITSETFYVECLNKMMQYRKAIRATLTTSQPVISDEEFQTVFYKVEELHEVHTTFLNALKAQLEQSDEGDLLVGEIFKRLVANMHLYAAFLHNYGRAIDTVKKCGQNNTQFKEIVSNIVMNSTMEQSLTLEDLLHKPVARVQKNSLVLTDLINATPANHPDHVALTETQKIIRNFLKEFNIIQRKTDDKALRRLVKYSYIVELTDGHRKLRYLFLFNDVICCCKCKASSRDRFEFEPKWSIPLRDIVVLSETTYDIKELNPVNILQLKTAASTLRDQIMLEEREKGRKADKGRKKLEELERQLLLASPNLAFRINNRASNKTMTFFLSSEYERTQWIDSIISLQQSCSLPGAAALNDLQEDIAACQRQITAESGSIVMRAGRDESLLVGDLHLTIQGLVGLDHAADLFICVEIDSYGHYFRKVKTKLVCRSASPVWNESFVLELEGSGNMRVLLYEDHAERPKLRAQYTVKLSRSWLQEIPTPKMLRLNDTLILNTVVKFMPGEVSLRRVPTSKPGSLFGVKMQQVLKREKRDIPFLISACIREVERRGMGEVGIYRVSGSASDLVRLKKSFETNPYEAEQLLKEVDVHSVTGILKSYLRELPEALFTDQCYPKLVETFNKFSNFNEANRIKALQEIARELPAQNQATINHILDHLIRVHHQEVENKMSLHNLAMVFGPTLLRPGPTTGKQPKDGLETSTVDVMAQAGILYCFLQARLK